MNLSELYIENFRLFGDALAAFRLEFQAGITAIIGENDSGKTAIVDALRLLLGTRDHDALRVEVQDFHVPTEGIARKEFWIRCRFDELSTEDVGTFAEYLSYRDATKDPKPTLFVNFRARLATGDLPRRAITVETRSGEKADGPLLDAAARALLCATYLRPLRDAERALASGKRSRLSQILQQTDAVRTMGVPFDASDPAKNPQLLSVVGIADLANNLIANHAGIKTARERLNDEYLNPLSFADKQLVGHFTVAGVEHTEDARLRQLLEKLELELREPDRPMANRGLGSNNMLFMACELLLLKTEPSGLPILLIEEPEAHLHPQRQLRLMQFLVEQANKRRSGEGRPLIQIFVTTHSPTLASALPVQSLVIVRAARAYALREECTALEQSDYAFLSRFLDATKANLFFARGVIIVEGDAENLFLPTLAELIGNDLSAYGVSIVNVGHTGLARYARVFQRANLAEAKEFDIPVACVADLDVMPNCAPKILGLLLDDGTTPPKKRWKTVDDLPAPLLEERRAKIGRRASGQHVRSFVSEYWTLEYDLARAGLARDVWIAAQLAVNDDRIADGSCSIAEATQQAESEFASLESSVTDPEELATHVYAPFYSGASKAAGAQYLAHRLRARVASGDLTREQLRAAVPKYLLAAIEYACRLTTNV